MAPSSRLLLAALAVGLVAVTPVDRVVAAQDDGLPGFLAPLRAGFLAREGKATLRASEPGVGAPADAFDGRPGSVFRTRGVNPAFLEVTFDRPREVLAAQLLLPGGKYEWSLLAGDDAENLPVRLRRRTVEGDAWSLVEDLSPPVRARVFRVVAKRTDGGDSVAFGEVSLLARQKPESLAVNLPSRQLAPLGGLPLRVRVAWDGGFRSDNALGLDFEVAPGAPIRVEPPSESDGSIRALRFEKAGTARLRAYIPGRGFRLESPWAEIECVEKGKPDWCVTHIERTPRIPFDGPNGGWPALGSSVAWVAHVRNYGTADAPRVPSRWIVDGKVAHEGALPPVVRFGEGTEEFRMPWDGQRHEIRYEVDPERTIEQAFTAKDACAVLSDALLVGFRVERRVVEFGLEAKRYLDDTDASWEDRMQDRVAGWNRTLAATKTPLTPRGIPDRVAIDRIEIVEEGELESSDSTVDLQRGFPAGGVDATLLRDLSRARGLADLSLLDVRADEVTLRSPEGAGLVHTSKSGRITGSAGDDDYSPHEAAALARRAGRRGRFGTAYLSDLPRSVAIRAVGKDGTPQDGVQVRAWRRAAPTGGGPEVFGGQPVRVGMTSNGGAYDLSLSGRDPFFEGETRGPLDPGHGVLLLELSRGGKSEYRFLEVVPYNLAFWAGESASHFEDVTVDLPR